MGVNMDWDGNFDCSTHRRLGSGLKQFGMRLEGVSTYDNGNWTLRLFVADPHLKISFVRRIRENGTDSNWVEAKFEVVVNPLPSLTTQVDLPILADVSLPF